MDILGKSGGKYQYDHVPFSLSDTAFFLLITEREKEKGSD